MKRLTSILLVLVIALSLVCTVSAASPEAKNAADALHDLGLFQGVGTNADGTPNYDLDRAPNRMEAVTMLVRLLGKEDEAKAGSWTTPFTDVADWAKPYVGYAYANKLTNGVSDTAFGGKDLVTASQYITFILRALGYDSSTDFKWNAAWELSDKLGITDGRYNASSSFTRGDVAVISNSSLDAKLKGQETTLRETLQLEGPGTKSTEPKAWFEVDEDSGTLSIETNIDASTWGEYALIIYTEYSKDGKTDSDFDTQTSRNPSTVRYNCTSYYSALQPGTTVKHTEFVVLNSIRALDAFWAISQQKGLEAKLSAVADQTIARFSLDTAISVVAGQEPLTLVDFSIEYSDDDTQETYYAQLAEPISPMGQYGLHYQRTSGTQKAGMSFIDRGSGILTFTREKDHFADAGSGATGNFYISHCVYSVEGDGSILCSTSTSTPFSYQFQ